LIHPCEIAARCVRNNKHRIFIKQNAVQLDKDREKIDEMILEEQQLNSINNDSQLNVNQHYYRYIIYIFITLFIIILFIKLMLDRLENGQNQRYKY
jgi:hypothetical protein